MSSRLPFSSMRLLDVATLTSLVSALPRFGRFSYSLSVGSTNAQGLERLYHNDSLGISFVTESQTEGHGRAGRAWESPAGSGIYVSTILPAELRASALASVGFWASLAVRQACLESDGVTLELKWPNDLLWHDRKCVGILAQSRSAGGAARFVVGVGINVNRPHQVPDSIAATACWLSDAAARELDRTALLGRLLAIYEQTFDRLLDSPKDIIVQWSEIAALDGKRVAVKAVDGSLLHEGVIVEVSADGALRLRTASGELVRVMLGDVDALPEGES
ncbi:MAG: biotin--[acetyl-CoA-carboxylase] ligase [Candidatus Eremiobacteraeota bacterium]|nr:biotin--[acetyl-CoA-carboxylase] ligase [Candidatus Eremiobacteraeota bacterium]